MAIAFTAAWFLIFVFAVFPYLFVTRGAKEGAVSSLKFACLLLLLLIAWVTLPRLFGSVF